MSAVGERDRIRDLLEAQGQVILGGDVNYPASGSFGYDTPEGSFIVTVTGGTLVPDAEPSVSAPAPAPKPAPTPKPATAPAVKSEPEPKTKSEPEPEKPKAAPRPATRNPSIQS